MSDVVFSELTSFSTIELLSSSVDVEEYRVSAGVDGSMRQIVRSISNGKFSSGFMQLYVYVEGEDEADDELVGVGYIEDWRPMCFPEEAVDSDESREVHMSEVRSERLDTLREETPFDESWDVLLDERDVMDGGGQYGQSQFFAVRSGVME